MFTLRKTSKKQKKISTISLQIQKNACHFLFFRLSATSAYKKLSIVLLQRSHVLHYQARVKKIYEFRLILLYRNTTFTTGFSRLQWWSDEASRYFASEPLTKREQATTIQGCCLGLPTQHFTRLRRSDCQQRGQRVGIF